MMRSDAQKAAELKYNQTEKGKKALVRYAQSEKGIATRRRHELSEKRKITQAKHRQTEKSKIRNHCYEQSEKCKATRAHYRQSGEGKIVGARIKAKRKRDLGYNPHNKRFSDCAGHHLNPEDVIFIPAELHKSIPHRQSDSELMEKINNAAFEWLCTQEII